MKMKAIFIVLVMSGLYAGKIFPKILVITISICWGASINLFESFRPHYDLWASEKAGFLSLRCNKIILCIFLTVTVKKFANLISDFISLASNSSIQRWNRNINRDGVKINYWRFIVITFSRKKIMSGGKLIQEKLYSANSIEIHNYISLGMQMILWK